LQDEENIVMILQKLQMIRCEEMVRIMKNVWLVELMMDWELISLDCAATG
jgi:hypothetical protein